MKKIIIGVVVLILLAAGCKYYFSRHKGRKTEYTKAVAVLGTISEQIDTTGEVSPLNRVEVKPTVSGRAEELLVEEGDRVEQGHILAYLSSADRVAILDAARAKGEAELKKWSDTYKPTPVVSPLSGTVILRNVVQGQTVDASTILFAVADNLIVLANVDEADIGKVRAGQQVEITLDAYPDKKITGKVFQILYEGKNVSNVITYDVKIRPDYMPANFKSQMTADIKIVINRKNNVVLLPLAAVQEQDGKKVVYTGAPAALVAVPVVTGMADDNNVEIISGVAAGETVYCVEQNYTPQKANAGTNPLMPGGRKPAGNSGSGTSGSQINRRAQRFMQ